MTRLSVLSLVALFSISISCNNNNGNMKTQKEVSTSNPLLQPSTLPFQAIPFDKITDADFQPAIEEGMKQQLAEIQKIANNPDSPTFENTLVTLEKSGQLLTRANNAFRVLAGANTDPEIQNVQQEEAPKMAANEDAIYLNSKLFKRVETIYNQREKLTQDP
ncbi:MAG TPA: dipeptidyl carboxypeptidase II, partial [Hanamia sp.]